MDISQSMRLLQQGLQRGGPAAPALDLQGASSSGNQLSQMDLHMLQNGMFGRPSSMMELQAAQLAAQGGAQFPLATPRSAMLVGTVAALQEESGQLRSQWKSDVARLERELGQLRSAAAWALPHLAEAQSQSNANLQVISGHGGAGSLQQSLVLQHQGQAERTQQVLLQQLAATAQQRFIPEAAPPASDREQLLARIAELEKQRDQALSQVRSSASDCSSAAFERPPPMEDRSQPKGLDLTEALLCQMRASHEDMQRSMLGQAVAAPQVPQDMGTAAAVPQAPLEFQDTLAGTRSTVVGPAATMAPMQEEQDLIVKAEIVRELERMEQELQKIRDENHRLTEDKKACEAAHGRDVSTLEAMLAQIMEDNKRLTKALSHTENLLVKSTEKKVSPMAMSVNPISSFDEMIASAKKVEGDPIAQSVHSVRSVAEPAFEPDIDRSGEFDRRAGLAS